MIDLLDFVVNVFEYSEGHFLKVSLVRVIPWVVVSWKANGVRKASLFRDGQAVVVGEEYVWPVLGQKADEEPPYQLAHQL